MSPWSNESSGARINIGIGTREIAVGPRASRWTWMRKSTPPSEPFCVPMPEEQCFTETGVFNGLRAALDPAPDSEAAPEKRTPAHIRGAHIVLDDFWGNHAILRGDFRSLRTREVDEVALAHFADAYGIDAEAVMVRACVQRGGRAVFASALPRTLADGIREAGASAGVGVRTLKLCLPEMLNRALDKMPRASAMLIFATDALMQAVLVEPKGWVGYDAQRLFAGDACDPQQVAVLAEQALERCAEGTTVRRDECGLTLYGFDIDPAPLNARFASVTALASPVGKMDDDTGESFARRLLEYAQ
ncbi:hypothetical protein LJ655_02345 [Paraburkholderia sp. MMS20-SJTN17]|uniref:Uncharacterized protein n=1 Tax=Paraburkholderia translucens TaxID=2886945 RepID=A0ABS8K7M8_9BURK|nr:hypothetical protein [Paraburkholderia sp. MMS20-SJTN17]MCC8400745.1 hypothetical protein [Paraburkholderia sp. MMS20-SJTN17]